MSESRFQTPSKQLLFIGTYAIPAGRFEEWEKANREMAEFVHAHEPRLLSFRTYINQDATEATTVMVHPDSESLEFHLEAARSKISSGVQLVVTRRIELYGNPSDRLLEQLRRISAVSGGWPLVVKTFLVGFPDEMSDHLPGGPRPM